MAINRSAPVLQRPVSFGKPPPLGIQRPRSISQKRDSSVGLKPVWDSPCTTWSIKPEDLESLPEDFPLERTHRFIRDADAKEVAERISKALKAHSIEAEYNTNPPKVKCKTKDFVSFRIRLYSGDDSGSPVVVEVQRRCGPASCFMQACRAVLNAAEGKMEKPAARSLPPFMSNPIGQMKCLQDVKVVSEDEEDTSATALADSVAMIRHEKRDTNVLGLENLNSLTDPMKTKPSMALKVAKTVVLGLENSDVREDLVAMIERDVFSTLDDLALSKHADFLRQVSLTIFANCLSLCAKDGCLAAESHQVWFNENLLPCLVDELKRASSDACCATQAAVCVNSFASASSSARDFLIDQGVCEALRKANEFGVECNQLLQEETQRCLDLFA